MLGKACRTGGMGDETVKASNIEFRERYRKAAWLMRREYRNNETVPAPLQMTAASVLIGAVVSAAACVGAEISR